VDRLGSQAHPMIQTLFPNNDAVFQDHSASVYTDGTVQSWYKILPQTVQNLYESIPRRTAAVLEANVVQHNINK
jgi:hypothetical protein